MEFKEAKIRGRHQHSFRVGEWADLSGVKIRCCEDGGHRLVYEATYDDGVVDYIATDDYVDYQIKSKTK